MNDKSRITVWLNPAAHTDSKYGAVTNALWLRRECERINQGDHECSVRTYHHDGSQALFYVNGYFENGLWVNARPEAEEGRKTSHNSPLY